ncbi:hypothetical protein [Lutispora sp.]|uniref:hypothetical protein n=1 Tax=Lutispora sp. TaxID=2828727 RepID=UPI0035627FD2
MQQVKLYIIIAMILLVSACNNNDLNSESNNSSSQVNEVKNTESPIDIADEEGEHQESSYVSQEESLSEFIIRLNDYIYEENSKGFQEFIDAYGVYSISYFDDGRDENNAILVYKNDVREDMFLVSSQSGKAGISLSGGTFSTEVKEIYFNDYEITNNALLNIDWLEKDESVIQNQLSDIIKGCQELILKNNEYIPQIFSLSNNYFAFSFSEINENTLEKFYGYWIIFEKVNDSYAIRAIIELQ